MYTLLSFLKELVMCLYHKRYHQLKNDSIFSNKAWINVKELHDVKAIFLYYKYLKDKNKIKE